MSAPAPARHRRFRHESVLGAWERVVASPPPVLKGWVREYVGWTEYAPSPVRRRELPGERVPFIIGWGSRYRILDAGTASGGRLLRSFTTGAYDTFTLVDLTGQSAGIQIDLTLPGARLLLGRPLRELTNRPVALDEVIGAEAHRLECRLHDAASWEERFALVDEMLLTRFASASVLAPEVSHAWQRLYDSGGLVPVHAIARESGWSQRHLARRVEQELGLAPKTLSRVLRFSRAARLISSRCCRRLADVASVCGYYDQAHFVRECRALAGVTPRELVASLLPDHGGFLVDG